MDKYTMPKQQIWINKHKTRIESVLPDVEFIPIDYISTEYKHKEFIDFEGKVDFIENYNKEAVDYILSTLTEREEKTLRMRYGLNDDHCATLEEVGRIFKITREMVRIVEKKALQKLKQSEQVKILFGLE